MMLQLNGWREMKVPPTDLSLDLNNPRLFDLGVRLQGLSENDLIKRLVVSSDIHELLLSIAANGFIPLEPLIVTGDSAPYKVLEGNRRLAAIQLYLNPILASDLDVKLPTISAEVKDSMQLIDVRHVENEEDAWPYIGFKHVNGPHKWSSLSKARFAARWYRSGDTTIEDISNRLGDKHSTIRKMLEGIFVLEQAEESSLFDIENRFPQKPFAFSHLYTALTRKEFRDFLNLGPMTTKITPGPNPVDQSHLENLETMLKWIYGNKNDNIDAVVSSQNPDLKNLGKVLINPIALDILEKEKSLEIAFDETTPKDVIFRSKLISAYSESRDALSRVYSYKGGDSQLEDIAEQLRDIASSIHDSMLKKSSQRTDLTR